MKNEAIKILEQYATYSSFDRTEFAVEVFQERGLHQPTCLLPALSMDDVHIRVLTMEVLAELEPDEATLPAVLYSLGDSHQSVRFAALEPLARFGKKAIAAFPILEKWLEGDDRLAQLLAADAICQIDIRQAQNILPFLIEVLENGGRSDKSNAADTIGNLGEAGLPALEALESLIWDENLSVQLDAAAAITKITGGPRVEISVCIDLLNAKGWLERYAGAEHLAFMGALAEPALPDLRRAMEEDEDDSVRGMAWLAMEQIDPWI